MNKFFLIVVMLLQFIAIDAIGQTRKQCPPPPDGDHNPPHNNDWGKENPFDTPPDYHPHDTSSWPPYYPDPEPADSTDIPVQDPIDPNEIIGTSGYDAMGDTLQWVAATSFLPYAIYFENDPELATAAAQKVEIRHALHPKADISTFAVGAFGFGSHVFTVEGNRSTYQQRLDLTQDMGIYVDVVAGIDIVAGEAFWIFQSIDPATGLPPQGTQQGFLPVNDENHSGEGYVSFTIKPKANACVTGDVVTASAYIIFDINEAIPTNVWHNTVDALPPTTQLTGTDNGNNEVLLQFSGQDDEGGCGLKQYKLYVSDNYGAYSLYDTYPVGSEVAFPTEYDHCYRFFCLGEDNVGNVEEMKEAEVVIEAYPDGFPFFVAGYGESTNAGWKFIASPIAGNIAATTVDNIFSATQYDLYYFDQGEALEWRNYKYEPFELENGQGYLYATKEDETLVFRGNYNEAEIFEVPLAYLENNPHVTIHGWNLIGNPFTMLAYADRSYYTMNEDGTAIEPIAVSEWAPIPACHGVMVKAEAQGEMVTFTRTVLQNAANQGNIQISVAKVDMRGSVTHDKAIVSFNPVDQLDKFIFNESTAKVYIPHGGKDYAIAYANKTGEIPVNFKAAKKGSYTLNVNADGMEFYYLHLIDNLTGNDVDLLVESAYTFEARTTDYASRFLLRFIPKDGSSTGSGTELFAYCFNDKWIITNEGDATLQVVDILGHVLSTERINGTCEKQMDAAAGVYLLRLINGNNVKVQKIVVK